jgi:hypothetical protein
MKPMVQQDRSCCEPDLVPPIGPLVLLTYFRRWVVCPPDDVRTILCLFAIMSSSTLNLSGLAFNFLGALLLIVFTSPALMVLQVRLFGFAVSTSTYAPDSSSSKKHPRIEMQSA